MFCITLPHYNNEEAAWLKYPANKLSMALWQGGWVKERELATTSLEFEFRLQFPCGSPQTELSDFHLSV